MADAVQDRPTPVVHEAHLVDTFRELIPTRDMVISHWKANKFFSLFSRRPSREDARKYERTTRHLVSAAIIPRDIAEPC